VALTRCVVREPRGAGKEGNRIAGVDIIVPVYGAADDLRRCLESVERHTDLATHRLLLVIDGPQDVDTRGHQALVNDTRRGFTFSANRGMRESAGDVVLLNSDTIVTARWLEKLIEAAGSAPNVATVTPFSNNATLVSLPRAFEENLIPTGFDVDSFAALVERVSSREYARLPTAVGFCMYIRRAALDDVGLFDEEHFPTGYGEENDFSMRASKRGWVHLLDDATFIYHAGHRSFQASRVELRRRGSSALRSLHPDYYSAISRFMKEDPLRPARERVTRELSVAAGVPARRAYTKIVHLVHGWPPFNRAGTEMYAWWLVQRQLRHRDVSVYARIADDARTKGEAVELSDCGARVRLVANNFLQRDPLSRNALRDRQLERDFARFLKEEQPKLIHVHHLAGHAFSLMRVARQLRVPIVYQIQDWWALCARVNLFDAWEQRCSGPSLMKCSRCAPLTRIAPGANLLLHAARRRAARAALAHADAFVMGSEAIRRDYAALLPRGKPVHVIPYGVDVAPLSTPREPARWPLRFGIVGGVLPHKGAHVAAEAFRELDPAKAVLRIWGNTSAAPQYAQRLRAIHPAISFEGTFDEPAKAEVFRSMDVLLVPSIGLESFGLVAREAMALGVPVVAANDGALAEINGALHFRSGDAASLRETIAPLIEDPRRIDRWREQLPRPKSVQEHAEEIEGVYASLVGRP